MRIYSLGLQRMNILALAFLVLAITSAQASERTPEQLLPPTTQFYAKWDGVAAHAGAYARSARGQMFSGESGKALDEIFDRVNRMVKMAVAGEPLLEGKLPDELLKIHADAKKLLLLPHVLREKGIVAGFEIRPPLFDLRTLYNLAKGDKATRKNLGEPQYQFTLIIPDSAEKPELAAGLRLLIRNAKSSIKEEVILDRQMTVNAELRDEYGFATWTEGKHVIFVYGNQPIEKMASRIQAAGAGITENSLFKKLAEFKDFRVVTRGFLDVANTVKPFRKLIESYDAEAWPILDATGLNCIKSACFWDGFDNEESRGVVEIRFTDDRKGLARMFRPKNGKSNPNPLKSSDLPPLPADLTRFSVARFDLEALYKLIPVVDKSLGVDSATEDGVRLSPEERLRRRMQKALDEFDEQLGLKMADFLSALDDKVATYHAPSDGLLSMGQVIAIGVKDEKKLRGCFEILLRKLEKSAKTEIALKQRACLGVDVTEIVVKGQSPVTITFAICDGWLVMGFQPQPVRGFIYRAKGKLPVWKPDAHTAAALAKVPEDRCVIQVADPRPTVQLLLSGAPILAGFVNSKDANEPQFDPGLFPHPAEATKHLFPNVCWCRDDGKTMRWESRDSLWLPMEFMGLEVFGLLGGWFTVK